MRVIFACVLVAAISACGGGHAGQSPDGGGDADRGDGGSNQHPGDGSTPDGPTVMGGDPGFGDDGLVTVNFGGGLAALTAVGQQSDGSIVAAGATQEAFVVLRATATGAIDPSFGTDGVVSLPIGRPTNGVEVDQVGLIVQADDDIVVAGRLLGGSYGSGFENDAVIRLTATGAVDASFGSGGVFVTDAAIDAIAATPAGDILVGPSFGGLLALTADGSVDTSFGSNGVGPVVSGGVAALAVGSNGTIVAANATGVTRYLANGAIDTAFAGTGTLAVANPSNQNVVTSVAITPDGGVLVGGSLGSAIGGDSPPFTLLRTTAAGALDPTFGTNGVVHDSDPDGGLAVGFALTGGGGSGSGILALGFAEFGSNFTRCVELDGNGNFVSLCSPAVFEPFGGPLVRADGSYVVPGLAEAELGADLALGVVSAGGASASITVAAGGSFDRAQALAIADDGSILVAGATLADAAPLIRLTGSGALDPTFGSGGFDQVLGTLDVRSINAVAIQPGGGIVVGYADGFAAARLTADDTLDPSFGANGSTTVTEIGDIGLAQGLGLAVAGDGSLYIAGEAFVDNVIQYGVLHLTANGALDTSFGSGGVATAAFADASLALDVSPGSDGSVIVSGETGAAVSIVRFDPTGALDPTFAGSGALVLVPVHASTALAALGLARGSDGSVIAVAGDPEFGELAVVRIAADGSVDTSFGSAGTATLELGGGNDDAAFEAPAGIAIDDAGNTLITVAVASPDGLLERAVIVRLLPDGSPDASWGPNGVQALAVSAGASGMSALQFQPDGKLVAAGRAWTVAGSSDFAVVRLVY